MRKSYILIIALSCLLILAGCSNKPYRSEGIYRSGYDDYMYGVEEVERDHELDYCSVSKDGYIKAIESAAEGVKEQCEEYGNTSIQGKDYDNLKTVLKLFDDDFTEYKDPDDYEPYSINGPPIDDPDTNSDYQMGIKDAKADLGEYLEEEGPFISYSDAREWIMDHMYALGSSDLNDYIDEMIIDLLDDCWLNVEDIERENNKAED